MADFLTNLFKNLKLSINSQFVNKEPWQIVALTTASVLTTVYIYEATFTRDPFDTDSLTGKLKKRVFKLARKIPFVRKKLEEETGR